ncbi:MAG: hypothetical protein QM723_26785 [Myxococcaceae bacterium]
MGASAHCDFTMSTTPEARCQERLDTIDAAVFKQACTASKGTAGDGACPTASRVGGCFLGKQGDGSSVNDWYYPPKTKDDAMHDCSGTFLNP